MLQKFIKKCDVYCKLLCLTKLQGKGVGTISVLRKNCKGAIPTLRKNCNSFALFPFINPFPITLSQMIIFTNFTYPFLLPSCPPNSLLINHILSWKTKLKHIGVDITCFLFFKMQNLH